MTPLAVSLLTGSQRDLVTLLEHGADPNRLSLEHLTPLYLAGISCNVDAARALLTHGADPLAGPIDARLTSPVTYPPEPDGVLRDVLDTLAAGARRALDAGVPAERILLDPTLDFGKTTAHSLTVLRGTADVVALGFPVLQAISRKDFVGETLALPAEERLEGSLAATAVAAWLGATVFRAHDVRATRRVLDMVATLRGDRPPALAVRGVPGA